MSHRIARNVCKAQFLESESQFVSAEISILLTKNVWTLLGLKQVGSASGYHCRRKAPCQLAPSSRMHKTIKGADNEVSSVCRQSAEKGMH